MFEFTSLFCTLDDFFQKNEDVERVWLELKRKVSYLVEHQKISIPNALDIGF